MAELSSVKKYTIGDPNGVEIDTTVYDKITVYKNATVEIYEDTKTGKISIGWYRQDNTIKIKG